MQPDGTIACKTCGTLNQSKNKFCKKCGTVLAVQCPHCGNNLDKDAEFCPECGYRLTSQAPPPPPPSISGLGFRKLPLGLEIMIALGLFTAAYFLFSSMMGFYVSYLAAGYEISETLSVAGILWGFLGLYFLVVSVGLWKLKEWSRKIIMFQAILGIITVFFEPIPGLASLVYGLLVLWYINQPSLKALFQSGQINAMSGQAIQGTGSGLRLAPTFNSKILVKIVIFIIVTIVLHFLVRFLLNFLYLDVGYAFYYLWVIPLIVAFLLLGPLLGLSIAFISVLLSNIIFGYTLDYILNETTVEFLIVAVLLAGIFVAQKLVMRKHPLKVNKIKILLYSIFLGVFFRLIIQPLIYVAYGYSFTEALNTSFYFYTEEGVIFAIVTAFIILVGYAIGTKLSKKS